MNRRGFTLIELLAVIILIGLLSIIIVPNALSSVEEGKESSYKMLIKNVVTSAQTYFEECEYGDLSDETKYDSYACKIQEDNILKKTYVNITLGTLANTGILNVNNIKVENGKEIRVVLDPKTDNDISFCKIKITKEVSPNYKVTYKIENNDSNEICPNTYEN